MATRVGSEVLAIVEANGDPALPDSPKGRFVQKLGNQFLLGGGSAIYKMRARDTGAGFVFWISTDATSNYPGIPIGSIVDKQIAATLSTG